MPAVEKLIELGFSVIATGGTAAHLAGKGLPVETVNKVAQGRPHIVDRLLDGEVVLVFNTTEGWQSLKDSHSIRATALTRKVPYFTTASASLAAARAIEAVRGRALEVALAPVLLFRFRRASFHRQSASCAGPGRARRAGLLKKGIDMASADKVPMLAEGYAS